MQTPLNFYKNCTKAQVDSSVKSIGSKHGTTVETVTLVEKSLRVDVRVAGLKK